MDKKDLKKFLKLAFIIALCYIVIIVGQSIIALYVNEMIADILNLIIFIGLSFIVFYSIISYFKVRIAMVRLSDLVFKKLDPDKCIVESSRIIDSLRKNWFGKAYVPTIISLQSLAYEAKGDYDNAIMQTEKIDIENEFSINKALLYNNLAYFYCEKGDFEKGHSIYKKSEKYIEAYMKNKKYKAGLKHTKAVIEYFKGNYNEAEEILKEVKLLSSDNYHVIAETNIYLSKILHDKGKIFEAKELLAYNLTLQLLPNTLTKTKKIQNELGL